ESDPKLCGNAETTRLQTENDALIARIEALETALKQIPDESRPKNER
ncbi:MAG: hypothetical protein ACI9IV_001488, partial [Paracoccaceae bacterium]